VSAIEVENLVVRIGRATLLSDVNLYVEPGTWCTVIGPNGAGKTTLIETVAGLRTPTSGTVRMSGDVVSTMKESERAKRVALVPQHPVIPVGMSVKEYVALGRIAYHGPLRSPRPHDRDVVDDVLERLSLADFAYRDVATLSGGERQRAVLARALAQGTMVVVLDEPITGLDLRHQIATLELLQREVHECGLTVLATLHDLTLAGQFADRLVLLSRGELVLDGPSAEVVRSVELADAYEMDLRVVNVDGGDVVVPVRH